MAELRGPLLVAEVGSLTTRVTLVDLVDGEARMVGHAEANSSLELPYQNALFGILEAVAQISEITGRLLIRDGQLITPRTGDQEGVDQLVVVTSAAGAMSLVITAIAADVSARSALHASRQTYTTVLQTITLDDAAGQPVAVADNLSWIERQVQALLDLNPDAVLIAGGLEGGAVDAVNRLAHIVGLTAIGMAVDSVGQQRQLITARPVIYAGNSAARDLVIAALSDRAEIFVVENLRPTLEQERLDPAREELARLYEKQVLPRLPGMAALRRLGRQPVRTVCDASGLMVRFLAERTGRRVLSLDVGAAATSLHYAAPGRFHPAVLGACGTSYGSTELLSELGPAALARWLPFPIADEDLVTRLLNRLLRPYSMPATREDLYISFALAGAAAARAYAALADEISPGDYDWLIAGGGVLAHTPEPGLALLTLLNALQPLAEHERQVIDVHLDTLGLLPVSGALAPLSSDAAVTLCDRDLLRNTPLASLVVLLGDGRAGEQAAEVALSVEDGRSETVTVAVGEIRRLPLAPGRNGRLVVRPSGAMRVGQLAPGAAFATDGYEVLGSALGVVVDARPRPLALPEDDRERCLLLWAWLVALGVERGESPYVAAAARERAARPDPRPAPASAAPERPAAPEVLVDSAAPRGRRISLADLAAQEQQAAAPADPGVSVLDSELDALRQTVEAPKKRGIFGRRK